MKNFNLSHAMGHPTRNFALEMSPPLIARKRDSFGEINLPSSQPMLLRIGPSMGRTQRTIINLLN